MADDYPESTATTNLTHTSSSFLKTLQEHAPIPSQPIGFITLVITGGILILLTGLTVLGTVLGLILFSPLIVLSSPIWIPIGATLFVTVVGLLSVCGFGVASLAGLLWMYKYFRGMQPPGSDRADYARRWIFDTARNVKEYARHYGGYLHSELKDVAPGT